MSATNRGAKREAQDRYLTPGGCVDSLLPFIDLSKVRSFLEPCKAAGAIYDRVDVSVKEWCELSEGRDYLTTEYPERFDLIITNPPFSLALEFLQKSLNEAKTGHLPAAVEHTGEPKTPELLESASTHTRIALAKRPSFKGKGSDATEYAWFAWDRGGLIRADGWLTVL